jgi:CBS-domain-containing membrane protein
MQVNEIMTRQVQSCRPDDSLERAAQLMWDYDCGCVPVCEGGDGVSRAIGVITDRDICMGALFQGKPLRELRVRNAMAQQLLACQPQHSLEQAERAMRNARVRRLPVIDDQGNLIGMLSLADIAREAAAEQSQSKREVTELEVNDTLAAICSAGQSTGASAPRVAAI